MTRVADKNTIFLFYVPGVGGFFPNHFNFDAGKREYEPKI